MAKKSGINRKFVEAVLLSKPVRDLVLDVGKQVAEAAGGEAKGYQVTDLVLEDPRAAVSVMATGHAANSNRKHHTLIRAMDAVRG